MKAKVLFLSAVSAVVVYSCTTERDEVINENPAKAKIEKLELKKLKPIKHGNTQANKTASDTIIANPPASPQSGFELDPGFEINPNPDPNDGGDPKDVPVPPRR